MAKNPARATRLNRQVPLKLATCSEAKKAAEMIANKNLMKSLGKPVSLADKRKLAVAQIHARDSEAFKHHAEVRADTPARGVDKVSFIPANPSMAQQNKDRSKGG